MALEGHVLKRVFFIGDRTFSHLNLIKKNPTNREVRCGNSVLKKNWNITWRTTFLLETQEKKRKLEYHLVGVVFCRDDDCIFEGNKHLQLMVHAKKKNTRNMFSIGQPFSILRWFRYIFDC